MQTNHIFPIDWNSINRILIEMQQQQKQFHDESIQRMKQIHKKMDDAFDKLINSLLEDPDSMGTSDIQADEVDTGITVEEDIVEENEELQTVDYLHFERSRELQTKENESFVQTEPTDSQISLGEAKFMVTKLNVKGILLNNPTLVTSTNDASADSCLLPLIHGSKTLELLCTPSVWINVLVNLPSNYSEKTLRKFCTSGVCINAPMNMSSQLTDSLRRSCTSHNFAGLKYVDSRHDGLDKPPPLPPEITYDFASINLGLPLNSMLGMSLLSYSCTNFKGLVTLVFPSKHKIGKEVFSDIWLLKPPEKLPFIVPRHSAIPFSCHGIMVTHVQLKNEEIRLRLNSIRKLSTIARALGEDRTRKELIPILSENNDDDDEVLHAITEELGVFIPYVGGVEHAHVLLPPLETLCTVEETCARDKAVESLCRIGVRMRDSELVEWFIPLVKRLAAGEWFTPRVSTCGMFHVAYPIAPDLLKTELRSIYGQLCQDDMPMVRRSAASNLGKFAATTEPAFVKTDIMSIFEDLTQDDQDSVSLLAVEGCSAWGKLLEPHDGVSHILPVIVSFSQDKSWRVRYTVANQLYELCEAVGPGSTKTDLVPAFVRLLRANEAEVCIAAAGKVTKFCRVEDPEIATLL